jgi:predicted NACHT family NTPase
MRELIHYPEFSILEFVKHFAEKDLSCSSLPQEFFDYWLRNGRAIILLDGLDEVPREQASKIIEKIIK